MSMIGKALAHYEITGQIGKGGMGEVYQARTGSSAEMWPSRFCQRNLPGTLTVLPGSYSCVHKPSFTPVFVRPQMVFLILFSLPIHYPVHNSGGRVDGKTAFGFGGEGDLRDVLIGMK